MSRSRSGGGLSGSMVGLSLGGGRPAAAPGWGQGGRGSNYGLGFGMSSSSGNMMSEHSRRKQDDEILAELERDPTANGNAAAAAAAAADKAAADESHSRGRKSRTPHDGDRGGRDKSYTTSLPREDAHRFRATIDEAVERLDLLGLITADSLRRRKDPATSHTRKDIFSLMRRETELEQQYEQLMQRRNELRGLSNKSKYIANQSELSEITQALKASTAAITANLKDHPTILGNINKIQKDRQALQQLLQDTIEELREENYNGSAAAASAAAAAAAAAAAGAASSGSGGDGSGDGSHTPGGTPLPAAVTGGYTPSYSYDQLVEAVARRSDEQSLLVETKLRQEKTAEALKRLQHELEHEWVEFEKLDDAKNAQIVDLTAQLKHQKKVTLLTVKYEQQTAVAHKETTERLRINRLNELRGQIARVKADLKTDKRVNKKSLVFLAGQKDAMDQLYEQWERNYDEDHGAKSRELDGLSRARHTDQVALVGQQQRWDADAAGKVALMEERALRGREEAAYRALMERMYLAQCTIRFYWKVYWRRRKKELKKLRRKKLARIRAQKKAEKNRPPSFGRSKPESENATAAASVAPSKPGSAGPSKPTSAR